MYRRPYDVNLAGYVCSRPYVAKTRVYPAGLMSKASCRLNAITLKEAYTMNDLNHTPASNSSSKSIIGSCLAVILVAGLSALPGQAAAATKTFNMKWVNSENPKETFSGTLKVDPALLPDSGVVNLANTAATFSVKVPQQGGATFSMADFSTFSVGMAKADMAKAAVGQELMGTGLVTQIQIYGKMGGPAHKKFNACGGEFGICFNREAVGPIYKLTSMTVGK